MSETTAAKVISEQELLGLVAKHGMKSEVVQPYFKLDSAEDGFGPVVSINTELVRMERLPIEDGKVGTNRVRNALIMNFANDLSRMDRLLRYEEAKRDTPNRIKIVSEGDSWTQYPVKLKDIVDNLMEEFNVLSLDAAGDKVIKMAQKQEFVQAISKEKPKVFLLSGGGNDFVGEKNGNDNLAAHLEMFDPAKTPEQHFKLSFETQLLASIKAAYLTIIQAAKNAGGPNLHIILHGYDYAVPGFKGGPPKGNANWITRNLEARAITDPEFQWAMVKVLIDRFNTMLGGLVETKVHHVDLRATITTTPNRTAAAQAWFDELHPENAGFKAAASRIATLIKSLPV